MSELSKAEICGDRKNIQNVKSPVVKKIYRKVVKKQVDNAGTFLVSTGNTRTATAITETKPKARHVVKAAIKKGNTQSTVKSSTPKVSKNKNLATKQPLIKIQKPQSDNKKHPISRNLNSITINKIETKKIKPAKHVLKAIPIAINLTRDTAFHKADRIKLTNPVKKQPVKVKRVLKKKNTLSLNGKTVKPKTVDSIAVETVLPINNTKTTSGHN